MERILKRLEELKLDFELFYEKVEANPLSFEQGELKALESKKSEGVGLRLIKDGKIGFAHSNQIDNPEIVDFALNSARFGKDVNFSFSEKAPYEKQDLYHETEWKVEELVEKGRKLIELLESKYKGIKLDIAFEKKVVHRKVITSCGFEGEYKKTVYAFSVAGFMITKSGFTYAFDADDSTLPLSDFERIIHDRIIPEFENMLGMANEVAKIPSGNYPVIFGPFALWGTFIPVISAGLNGVNIYKGISPLKDKIGEKIFGEKLTVIDDPEDVHLTGARPFDDEGIPARKKKIIENGILRRHLHTLDSASKLGVKPEGNGIRSSYSSMPAPGFTNLVIEKGDKSLNEIIKSLDKGILVYSVIGGGQSNVVMGDYSVNIGLGYYIENGEIKGRVKDCMIAGNVYEDFQKVMEISSESKRVFSRVLPYILVENVKLAAK